MHTRSVKDKRLVNCLHILRYPSFTIFSISDEAPETISKIVHVYWDGAEKLSKIDNGTLITEIPIDQDKSQAVEAKLREKLNNTNTDKSRTKRSIPFEGNGLSIVRKVCPRTYKIKKILGSFTT